MTIVSEDAVRDGGSYQTRPATAASRAQAWPSAQQLNSLRGLACLLLVAFHVSEEAVAHLSASVPMLMAFHEVMEPVRMPLFSFLSGFIYALRPVAPGAILDFERKKVRRLLVPFLSLTVIIFAMRMVVPNDQAEHFGFVHYLIHPFSHLWFLQALFYVFLVYAVADSLFAGAPRRTAAAIFAVSLALFVSPLRDVSVLSVGDAAYILPFFSLGVLACRNRAWLEANARPLTTLLAVIVSLFFVYAFRLVLGGGEITKVDPVILMMSLSSILLLLMVFPRVNWLASIGIYSFSIYLFHTIFAAVAEKVSPDSALISLPFGFLAAVLGPVVIEKVITRYLPVFGFVIGKSVRAKHEPGTSASGRPATS